MKFQFTLIITFLFFLTNCAQLPKTKLPLWKQKLEPEVSNDSLRIQFNNPLNCPLRISAKTSNGAIQEKIANNFPVLIDPHKDTLFTYWTNQSQDEIPINFSLTIGNPNDSIHKKKINLPFKKGNKYKIIQGYNGSYSHNSEYVKCAIDFNLLEGDTICAAADGFVVGVIEGYERGGRLKRWTDYANYIIVFHPEMNIYTEYVHLTYNGSLVEVGDYVKSEQAIGLSGKTGRTDVEHLHFNVLKSIKSGNGMESTEINFVEGYRGVDLKKGDWVEK